MASRISRKVCTLGRPGALGTGRWASMQDHSASDRSVWYALLMLGTLPSYLLKTPFRTVSEGEFSEVRPNGVLGSSLRAELFLYHGLCRLRGGYGIRVAVHHLPIAILGSKDHRSPQIERGNLLASADLGLWVLYLDYVGKLRSYMLRYDLDANEPTLSDLRGGTVRDLSNLIPPTHGRAIGVSEGYVVSTGPQLLQRLWVPFEELIAP